LSNPTNEARTSSRDPSFAISFMAVSDIKDLLKKNKIPAAMKLSSDYRNWFADDKRNIDFQKEVDSLLIYSCVSILSGCVVRILNM
jgi:hypothetical protein